MSISKPIIEKNLYRSVYSVDVKVYIYLKQLLLFVLINNRVVILTLLWHQKF